MALGGGVVYWGTVIRFSESIASPNATVYPNAIYSLLHRRRMGHDGACHLGYRLRRPSWISGFPHVSLMSLSRSSFLCLLTENKPN